MRTTQNVLYTIRCSDSPIMMNSLVLPTGFMDDDASSNSTTSTACSTPMPTPFLHDDAKHVLIVGGGVIGLGIAVLLLQQHPEYRVTLVARDYSFDGRASPSFASPYAGAVWKTFDEDGTSRQARWEANTFATWLDMKQQQHSKIVDSASKTKLPFVDDSILALTRLHQRVHDNGEAHTPHSSWWKNVVLDFAMHDDNTQAFTTFTLDPPAYLQALHTICSASSRFSSYVAEVASLRVARDIFAPSATLIVNATGLGALHLTDVADALVEPIRGQTVLLHFPSEIDIASNLPCFFLNEQPARPPTDCFYVVPRAHSGHVLLGGTTEVGSFSVEPNEQQALRILCDAIIHYEPLQRLTARQKRAALWHVEEHDAMHTDSDDDGSGGLEGRKAALVRTLRRQTGMPIVAVDAGLRPSRKGGPRVDVQPPSATCSSYNAVPIVHAYGFGRSGFQCSWGVAEDVVSLIQNQHNQPHAFVKSTQ